MSKNGWADSEIREWLNNDFYADLTEDGFKGIKILETELSANATDKIFLLSVNEVNNSQYAVIRDGWTRSVEVKTNAGYTYYYYMNDSDEIDVDLSNSEKNIYPAMWVTIEK